jgi:hypothetical protein
VIVLIESTLDFDNTTSHISKLLAKYVVVGTSLLFPQGIDGRSQLTHEKVMVMPEKVDSALCLIILRRATTTGETNLRRAEDGREEAEMFGTDMNGQSRPNQIEQFKALTFVRPLQRGQYVMYQPIYFRVVISQHICRLWRLVISTWHHSQSNDPCS